MAGNPGTKGRARSKLKTKRALLYFYLDDQLHKILFVNRPANIVICWRYADNKRVQYVWSDIQRNAKPSFTTTQVAKMLGRHPQNVKVYAISGCIPAPQKAFPPGKNLDETWNGAFKWSEKDVMNLHDYLLTQHYGRPRKDGLVFPKNMPTKAEVKALMRDEQIYYVKNNDGEMVPVWKAVDW